MCPDISYRLPNNVRHRNLKSVNIGEWEAWTHDLMVQLFVIGRFKSMIHRPPFYRDPVLVTGQYSLHFFFINQNSDN